MTIELADIVSNDWYTFDGISCTGQEILDLLAVEIGIVLHPAQIEQGMMEFEVGRQSQYSTNGGWALYTAISNAINDTDYDKVSEAYYEIVDAYENFKSSHDIEIYDDDDDYDAISFENYYSYYDIEIA